jgi:DNA-binding winged helix-turn-helix (wHTH) protein
MRLFSSDLFPVPCNPDAGHAMWPSSQSCAKSGRLISKDELVKTVWPNTFVTDDALTHCISEVRGALGDCDQRIIKTVPRRGYLFVAPVSVRTTAAGSPTLPVISLPSSQIHGEAPSNVGSIDVAQSFVRSDKPSIAVLPFQNMSSDSDRSLPPRTRQRS